MISGCGGCGSRVGRELTTQSPHGASEGWRAGSPSEERMAAGPGRSLPWYQREQAN